jgi:hypothetical protein
MRAIGLFDKNVGILIYYDTFCRKANKIIILYFRKKIVNRGFIETPRRRHADCKKSVEYEEEY